MFEIFRRVPHFLCLVAATWSLACSAESGADDGPVGTVPVPGGGDPTTATAAEEPPPGVALTPASGTFEGQVAVTLSPLSPGAEIRYTIDGTAPTATSPLYDGTPITLTATTQIRAQAWLDGAPSGSGGRGVFVARTFDATSDLPLVIIDGYGGGKPANKEVYLDAAVLSFEPVNGVSALSAAPTLASRAGYHVRGQSSATFDQTPYKVELWNELNEDFDQPFVGLPDEADWAFIGPFSDRSLIRNAFVYELGRQMGLQAPRFAFVELYLNYEARPLQATDYQGIYMVVETIKNANTRLNLKKLNETDVAEPDISGGYIFKFDWMAAEEPILTCGGADPVNDQSAGNLFAMCPEETAGMFPFHFGGCPEDPPMPNPFADFNPEDFMPPPMDPKPEGTCWADLEVVDPDPLSEGQRAWLTQYVVNVNDSIHSHSAYADFIDVASFVDTFIINELTRNMDAYVRSVYFYKERGEKVVAGPLWDFNLIMALGGFFCNDNPVGWQYEMRKGTNDWFQTLAADPGFMTQVATRWKELRQGLLSQASTDALIATLSAPLASAAVRDFARWPTCQVSKGIFLVPAGDTWESQLQVMKDFLLQRAAWMDSQLP